MSRPVPLRIAIVHYHLKAGGVTRVIENAVASLDKQEMRTVVLSGEPYAGDALQVTRAVEGLGYCSIGDAPDPVILAGKMRDAATEALGGEPDIWHIHNHSLGKNPSLPGAVSSLAKQGRGMLLQIHDFAEDGRPANYAALKDVDVLYPQAKHIHYAALNGRDARFLGNAGIPAEKLHTLANPVSVPRSAIERSTPARLPETGFLFIYPTRGIRRKNLGEMLLWAAMAEEGEHFATTLTPANPTWLGIHDRWVEFAAGLKLPATFGVADTGNPDFLDWVKGAYALITTSVAEGFGLAFLEPWLFGKPLVGRDLPAITTDFRESSVNLNALYDRLEVPLDLVGSGNLRACFEYALKSYYAAYGRNLPQEAVERCWAAAVKNGAVDFGCLNEPLQERVIEAVSASLTLKQSIRPGNLEFDAAADSIAHNRDCIAGQFNLEAYGRRLAGIYTKIATAPNEAPDALDPERVLDEFLNPENFRLLRN